MARYILFFTQLGVGVLHVLENLRSILDLCQGVGGVPNLHVRVLTGRDLFRKRVEERLD